MNKPFALAVVDSRDPDLSEDDRPVCGQCTRDEDEVLFEAEACQLSVREVRCA